MRQYPEATYRQIRIEGASLCAVSTVNDEWVQKLWRWIRLERVDHDAPAHANQVANYVCVRRDGHINVECDGPKGIDRVFVKIYLPRKGHSIVRRLRPNRARREGAGARAFAKAQLPTPPLLVYGDERRFGLFQRGVVVTVKVAIEDSVSCYERTRDEDVLVSATHVMAMIHRNGLSHGDACIRNFACLDSKPMIIDLPSWGRLSRRSWLDDSTRFFGTVIKLTDDEDVAARMMEIYEELYGRLVVDREGLMVLARAFAAKITKA